MNRLLLRVLSPRLCVYVCVCVCVNSVGWNAPMFVLFIHAVHIFAYELASQDQLACLPSNCSPLFVIVLDPPPSYLYLERISHDCGKMHLPHISKIKKCNYLANIWLYSVEDIWLSTAKSSDAYPDQCCKIFTCLFQAQ